MAKRPDLAHVKWVKAKGKLYAYFNTGRKTAKGSIIYAPLPDWRSEGFFDSYAALMGGRTKRAQTSYTIERLAGDYRNSGEFTEKAEGTRTLYGRTLDRIVDLLGDHPEDDLDPEDLQLVLDNEMAGPGAHNIFVAVLGVIYTFARRRRKTKLEPTKDIAKRDVGEHAAWPEHVLEAGLESKHVRTRLAIHLLYFTGQRIGDVVQMRWSDIRGDAIFVSPQKTRRKKKGPRTLRIPLHSELAAELANTPKRGLTIIVNERGGRMGHQVIRKELKAHGIKFGVEVVPHGLRKNAVISLLEAGASIAETAAITDQTYAVVEHYARQVDQARLGSAAILKLENKRGAGKPTGKLAENANENRAGK